MKIPTALSQFLGKRNEEREYLFSLILDADAVAVAAWYLALEKVPKLASIVSAPLANDSWDERIQVTDKLLSAAEDGAKVEKAIRKTVLGIPVLYLTPEGNIAAGVRGQLKKLTQMLDLTAVGFVSLSQALAFHLKKAEGVPPSAILIGVSGGKLVVSIFRVGKLLGEEILGLEEHPAILVEGVLKKYQDGDVLPSRILLYGGLSVKLEELKAQLLKHPWPTRVNFLHFPKIEVVATETLLHAVSLSGASELASEIGESEEEAEEAETVVAQPREKEPPVAEAAEPVEAEEREVEELPPSEKITEESREEELRKEAVISEKEAVEPGVEESNVEFVSPEALGFAKKDILEQAPSPPAGRAGTLPGRPAGKQAPQAPKEEGYGEEEKPRRKLALKIPRFDVAAFVKFIPRLPRPRHLRLPLVGGVVAIFGLGFLAYYLLPRATVTVLVVPETIEEKATLTVDVTATVADPATKVIPGHKQEQQISGEKTIPVTGKKSVGDPARGSVTIYNKALSERSLKKGAVLVAKGLSFTLDNDVKVASASESIGSITFGKAEAAITAVDIGAAGNLPTGTEFTFKDIATSVASARNEAALTGGTSREVTVVSRSDYDALLKALSEELVKKAQGELSARVGNERLITETVKTQVTEKTFDKELDQEAKEVSGNVTITVSGISVAEEDIKTLLLSLVGAKVPAGYTLDPGKTSVAVGQAQIKQVKKETTILLPVSLSAAALPQLDTAALSAHLAGQRVDAALEKLKQTPGVAGAEVRFVLSPTKNRLPINRGNIRLTVAVQ